MWWVVEVVPLGVTALIPIIILPVLGLTELKTVTSAYSNPVIYLFLGGFIIARALEKTKLNERIALRILSVTGRSDRGVLLGFIIATAFLSMWISNTATTVMMVPIAMSVVQFLRNNVENLDSKTLRGFQISLFLAIAYSANIGGVMTPVGTPPNVVLLGYLDDLYSQQVDFWKWMLIGVPVGVSVISIMYYLLIRIFPFAIEIGKDFQSFVKKKLTTLGSIDSKQKLTIIIFASVCGLWVFKGLIHYIFGAKFLNDTSIALFGGLALFLIPYKDVNWRRVLDIDDIGFLPWNIVLLFGGGMAIAGALNQVGLIDVVTSAVSGGVTPGSSEMNIWLLTLGLTCVALFLTEIMSNVALCVVALPVIMKLSESAGLHPMVIGIPAAMASSFAFSLPISTPPNAIVFGTNVIKVRDMIKIGLILNFLGLAVIVTLGWAIIRYIFG